jgi:alpha-glucoside transport system permease protein
MEPTTEPIEQHRPVGEKEVKTRGPLDWLATNVVRILISLFVPLITFLGLYAGFIFLRDTDAPKGVVAVVAIIWGVGGVAALYLVSNWLVEKLGDDWRARIQPFVFVGPAIAILIIYLLYPTIATFRLSLYNSTGQVFVGLQNYVEVFTNRNMFTAFRNNILFWIPFGAFFTVILGLLIAVLADRSKYERFSKSLIFMPMAISMVGAAVIWNMIYDVNPNIGMLNAIYTAITGNPPQAWTASNQPWNNLFLILVMIWLQAGYAMVLFSAAIKGIPADILEAARVDGANEVQVFFQIMIPSIRGTIITVGTTVVIFTLKIFDVVQVMTGGQFDTQVIATQFYREYFTARNSGFATAIAIVLLIFVIPVMVYNLKQFSEREAF